MTTNALMRDLKKRRPFESEEQEVVISLLRTNELFQHRFGQLLRGYGLTQPQYNILRILRGEGRELPSLEIAERMISVVPAITNLLDKLEKRGLVERERYKRDRRVWHVHLTPGGAELLDKLDEPNLDMHKTLVGHLKTPERKQLLALLEKARASVAAVKGRS
jgi:DNA-binding MarR family transcriptional regulator